MAGGAKESKVGTLLRLLIGLLALGVMAYVVWRTHRVRHRRRRREAWLARREEENRIWHEKIGKD